MKINTAEPFALAYLDWAKESKGATSLEETERHDWVMEFGKLFSQAGGRVTGLDIAIAKGGK